MQIQPINNNDTNFKAITGVKHKGKFFKKNPELIQPILEKIVPDERYNFPDKSIKVVVKSTDFADFCTRMLYGITSDDPRINIKTVELLFYENLKGNMISRAWKHIRGVFTNEEETSPYRLLSWNYTLDWAYEGMLNLLDNAKTQPSKDWQY